MDTSAVTDPAVLAACVSDGFDEVIATVKPRRRRRR
jgi:hypothetical protein